MSNASQIWIMLFIAVLQIVAVVWIAWRIYRAHDSGTRHVRVFQAACVAAAFWFITGTLWSEIGQAFKPAIGMMFLPQIITTWPAHEAALVLSGHGLGANVRTPVLITSVCALVWALMLWSPLLAVRLEKVSVFTALTVEVIALMVVGGLFFKYGNG